MTRARVELADLPSMDAEIRRRSFAFNRRPGHRNNRGRVPEPTGGSAAGFGGDFGSLFSGVIHYIRSDVNITQAGGNITGWGGIVGPDITPAAGLYIGTVGPSTNGHTSVMSDASVDQGGKYTLARPAPATEPTFFWLIWKLISAPTAGLNTIFSDQNSAMCIYTDTGATNLKVPGGLALAGPVTVFGVTEVLFAGNPTTSLRFCTPAAVSGDIGNTVPNALRGIFGTNLGGNRVAAELLVMVTTNVAPSAATLLAARAAATSFYGASVQV